MRRGGIVGGAAIVLVLVAACSNETIVLATVADDTDAGTTSRRPGAKCSQSSQCEVEDGEFCLIDPKSGAGHCSHKPLLCSDDKFRPVCGASGISYFSDCYRRQAGESTATDGECNDNPRICDNKTIFCPTGATCDLLGGGVPGAKACGIGVGRCWGIVKCEPPDPGTHDGWDECSTEGGALRCVDTCTAIQSGLRFTHHENCR